MPGQRRRQGVATTAVETAHAADVALEMALAQEVGERGLLEHRGAPIGVPLGAGEGRHQRRRHHQVAETQAGEHHVGERAHVDHRRRLAQALQRRQRRAAVVVLAVVVVLDHHHTAGAGPVEQLEPPRQRHRRARRELVRRRHEDHARRVGQRRDGNAVALHRHRMQPGAVRLEELPRARVARILDRRDVAGIEEHAGAQVERLLRAADHDHLAGLAAHRARPPEVGGDLAAEALVAGAAIGRLPRHGGQRSHVTHHEAAPDPDREGVEIGAQLGEIDRARRGHDVGDGRCGGDTGSVSRQPDRRRHVGSRRGALARRQQIRQLARDEAARAALGLQVPLRRELIVGGRHRRPRHVQQIRELPRRRHAVAGREPAGQDPVPPLIVDLPV